MTTYDVTQSDALYTRAKAVIPGGVYGHYGYAVRPDGPKFFERADGARFWDADGNEYIDMMCAYGPNILGYNHEAVDEAAAQQMAKGNTVSVAAPIMIDLAEALVGLVSGVDWAVFGKNGGDSTTLSVMISRAATGREKIVKVQDSYHGVAHWMLDGGAGTIPDDDKHVLRVPWNDVEAFETLIERYPDQIACFIAAPTDQPVMRDNTLPADDYWPRIEKTCRKHGIILIVDDVRAGFRINLAGSHAEYGFQPDLVCFGKAIGNGHPISALVGTDDLKPAAEAVYYSGTQFFNAAPMAAAKATLEALQAEDAATRMRRFGEALNEALVNTAAQFGYELVASGVPTMPYYRLANTDSQTHARWVDECVKRGVYLLSYHNHFVSLAHEDSDIDLICAAAADAFRVLGPPNQTPRG